MSVATGLARYNQLPWGRVSAQQLTGGNCCCSTRVLSTTGQFNNKAVLNRQDEEVPDQEEQDEISENEAEEEEEEFCARKSLWETGESLDSQLHMEIAVKVMSRALWAERWVKLPIAQLTGCCWAEQGYSCYLKVHHWYLNIYLPEIFWITLHDHFVPQFIWHCFVPPFCCSWRLFSLMW